MKRLTSCCGIFCLLLLAATWPQSNVAAQQAASAAMPNYAGTWTLDKAKSESLPPNYQGAENIELILTQDDKQLTMELKGLSGPQAAMAQKMTYKLDGSPTIAEITGRATGKATTKAKMSSDGKTLELSTVRNLQFQGMDVTITSTDRLELAADGKTLKIARTTESPRGTQEAKLAFNKK